jgi:hypothetical protein
MTSHDQRTGTSEPEGGPAMSVAPPTSGQRTIAVTTMFMRDQLVMAGWRLVGRDYRGWIMQSSGTGGMKLPADMGCADCETTG